MIRNRRKVRKTSWRWEIVDGSYQKFPDDRLVALHNAKGDAWYREQTRLMAQRQKFRCGLEPYGECLFPGIRMMGDEQLAPTFEHFNKRGAGKQTDSIDPETKNCAAHAACNGRLGSRRISTEN